METLEWLERGSEHHTAKRTIDKLIISLANYERETIAEFQNIVYRAKKIAASHGWPVEEHQSGRFSGIDEIRITLPSRLPDIPPNSIKRRLVHYIANDEINTPEEFEKLLTSMLKFAERTFYFFWLEGQQPNNFINSADRTALIVIGQMDFGYYRHPNFDSDYVHIDAVNPSFDWEKAVVAQGPRFIRATLTLSEHERRRRDHASFQNKPSDEIFFFKPGIYGVGFDGRKLFAKLKQRFGRWFGIAK